MILVACYCHVQLDKEQQLKAQLQQAQTELQPLEEKVVQIRQRARVNNNGFVWLGLGGTHVQYDLFCASLIVQFLFVLLHSYSN